MSPKTQEPLIVYKQQPSFYTITLTALVKFPINITFRTNPLWIKLSII
ncbi:hypothetical protein BACFRA24663_17205 [Bacteroides fragilis]